MPRAYTADKAQRFERIGNPTEVSPEHREPDEQPEDVPVVILPLPAAMHNEGFTSYKGYSEWFGTNAFVTRVAKVDLRMDYWQVVTSALVAGSLAKTATAPLEVYKVRAQIGTPDSRAGILWTLAKMKQKEGLRSWWKGNFTNCFRLVPSYLIQFGIYAHYREKWRDLDTGFVPANWAAVAGMSGAIISAAVTYPFDVVKTRLIIFPQKKYYSGMLMAFIKIAKDENIFQFYRGFLPAFMTVVPKAAITWGVYESLHKYVWGSSLEHIPFYGEFINGCIAGALANTMLYPVELGSRRLQMYINTVPEKYRTDIITKSFIRGLAETVRIGGLQAIWRGWGASMIRVVPYYGFAFMGFEAFKRLFVFQNGYTTDPISHQPREGIDQLWFKETVSDWLKSRREATFAMQTGIEVPAPGDPDEYVSLYEDEEDEIRTDPVFAPADSFEEGETAPIFPLWEQQNLRQSEIPTSVLHEDSYEIIGQTYADYLDGLRAKREAAQEYEEARTKMIDESNRKRKNK